LNKQSAKAKAKKEPVKLKEAAVQNPEASGDSREKKILIKEKTPEEKQKAHKEGIIKTIVASILGILAGVIVFSLYGTGEDRIWYAILTIVIAITYFVQKLIYPQLKVDVKEFKAKDWLFVEFVVVDFFLVTWTLLLN
jgi:TRAP-type uncharacterized transport system fused permease subunit